MPHFPGNPRTLNDLFFAQVQGDLHDHVYIKYKPERGKPYADITYGEFGERAVLLSKALHAIGIRRGDRIALISESRPEWVTVDFAALLLGAITVPMFPTLTPKQVEHILVDSGAKLACVSNDLQLSKVVRSLDATRELSNIIVFNDSFKAVSDVITSRISCMRDVLKRAAESTADIPSEARKAAPDDVITIIYTSGTTGTPKGVMLTHHNLLSNIEGALEILPTVSKEDTFLSFLPLSHSFERVASYLKFTRGVTVAYAESVDTVADNMLEIRPTIMTGVPRFYERIYGRICRMKEKMSPTKRKIFEWAQSVGGEVGKAYEGEAVNASAKLLHPLADKLVLHKVRERTGGRIRFFVSGGAALPAEVGRAFAAFGLRVIEGYGMTESSPIISANPWQKVKWGSVGLPLSNVQVRIGDDGEILTRGPHVMKGYYNDPDATKDVIDSEGWLHTGDIGNIDNEGYIHITDRKKHLLVSSGGKNIAPGPIESLISQSQFIDQVMLLGDKRQFCTALIIPEFEAVREHLRAKGLESNKSNAELATDENVRELIENEIAVFQKEVANYERVRRFALLAEPFTVENSLMTPTLKIKRKEVEKRYSDLIETLYQDSRQLVS